MAHQKHIERGEPSGLTLVDVCGGLVAADYMRHVLELEFTASLRNLHHRLELQPQLLSYMKAVFDQKWIHCERAMQEQMEAQKRELPNILSEERRRAHVINHSPLFAGLSRGSPSGMCGLENTKSTTCSTLGSERKGEMVTVVEYKSWALRAPALY